MVRSIVPADEKIDQILAILACRSERKRSLLEMLQGGNGLAGLFTGALPARPCDEILVHLYAGIVGQAIPAELDEGRRVLLLQVPDLSLGQGQSPFGLGEQQGGAKLDQPLPDRTLPIDITWAAILGSASDWTTYDL